MLDPRDRVLAGVSGGADSVCLILVLKELGHEVAVAHVHHGLRGVAADDDESFTRELAERLGVGYFAKRVSLIEGNVEAAGRRARKEYFNELTRRYGFTKIALAHTRDDRVETFIMNLLRGSGSEGLVSMAPASGNTIRPLIETLGKTLEILEDEDAWMRSITDRWLSEKGTTEQDEVVIPVEALTSWPVGFIRRILRSALRHAGSELRDVSFEHIEAIRRLLDLGKSGKLVEVPRGLVVTREFDRLVFRQRAAPLSDYEYELKIPGEVHIPELGKVFRAEIVEKKANETGMGRVFVDGDSIGPCVRIRNWKPGDYYRPVGWPAGKLKKLFQRARIPRSHRTNWPVVVANSTLVWVVSFPVSREFAPGARSQRLVAIEALPTRNSV